VKKNWLVAGIAIGLIILTVGAVAVVRLKKQSILSPLGETPTQKAQLPSWEDPAGFKFSYPDGIKINPHEEDTVNYAHLELTSTGHSGGILIWMKDTNYKTLDEWVKDEASDAQVFDSELGGKPAKKVAYVSPQKLVVATIDVDVLVLVEVSLDEEGYWQGVNDQILSSFEFIPLEGEPTSAAPGSRQGGGGVIEEEEEIVE